MSARAIGNATVSFGLVSIPVKLYSASRASSRIHFNLLHEDCGARLKQQYICPTHNAVVPSANMVKGYEFARGQFVQFTSAEVKALEEKPNQSIDINAFVPVDKVDLLYYDKAYYLAPDKGGERAYALLARAMRKTDRVALAKYAARGKQYLVLVRVTEKTLIMQQLHYAHEIAPMDEVPVGTVDVKPSELDLAVQLIGHITADAFEPEAYTDEVRTRIEAAIAQKVEGQAITLAPAEAPKAQIVDLMAALKASIGAGDDAGGSGSSSGAQAAPKGRKPAKKVGKGAKTAANGKRARKAH